MIKGNFEPGFHIKVFKIKANSVSWNEPEVSAFALTGVTLVISMRILQMCLQLQRTTAVVAPLSIFSIRSCGCALRLKACAASVLVFHALHGRPDTNHRNWKPLLFGSHNYTWKSCKWGGGRAAAPCLTTFQGKVEIALLAYCVAECKYCRNVFLLRALLQACRLRPYYNFFPL